MLSDSSAGHPQDTHGVKSRLCASHGSVRPSCPTRIDQAGRRIEPAASVGRVADVELTVVTMAFDAAPGSEETLAALLSRYVVVSRSHPGCRNIDLCASVTRPGRFVVIQKWESPDAQRAHFDSPEMVEMARACEGLLVTRPDLDLLEGISAHDLA